ncbi:MDR family MFS transporter [Aspergillus aculeatinus CBS 121060]|uniref:Efflux pump protein n=1 Tax=Aspergillus aculeatinus CBS 121060 TaxID=1448322 RepID=A0ACD1H9W6_9EURO|nr:efflux pump protein [Aspergillus aculeatinus CBS 121060]RAH70391.1 efflux pump protein [Aspergillus aculeatinus CBS 121060]
MDNVQSSPWTRPAPTESESELHHPLPDEKEDGLAGAGDSQRALGSATTADESHEYITGLRLFAVLASVTLAAFLMLLDGSIIGVAIPNITSQFHSLDDVGWYTAAYQLASAALQPLSGKVYTFYNTKWSYLFFFGVFELGSLICGLANSSSMLIGGRAIAGMGSSGLLNGGMTIIAGSVPLEKRPIYTGIYLGISQVGIICGPLIGGALTQYTTWRWCFYINLPVGAVTAVLLLFMHVPELTTKAPFSLALVRRTLPDLDLLGFALFAPAAIMVLLALQYGGNDYSWDSSVVIGLFCGAGATAIVFAQWEKRMGERAMIPTSMVSARIVYSSAINGGMLVASILVAAQYLPIYFQGVREYGPAMSGVNTLPGILSQLLMVILSGAFVQKLGYYLPFAAAGSAISAVGNGLVTMFAPSTPTGKWIGYQIVLGSGRGIGMQMGIIAIQNHLSVHLISIGIAFMIFCQNFAGAVFVVVAEVIFRQQLVKEIRLHAPQVSVDAALAAGASASSVRALVPEGSGSSAELEGVLLAFANSLDKVFYLLMACCLTGFVAAFGMGWVDVRKKKTIGEGEEEGK